MDWREISKNPIFIGGHRKSGTTLLGSLLGGHEKIFTCPGETGFFYRYYPVLDGVSHGNSKKKENIEYLLNSFDQLVVEWIPESCRSNYKFSELKDSFWSDIKSNFNSKNIHLILMQHIFSHLKKEGLDYTFWCEKSTSMEMFADVLFSWYPKGKMIHLLRDPRDNYASIKSGWEKHYKNQFDSLERLLQSVIDRALLGMRFAVLNQQRYPKQYLVLRFEDLVSDTEVEMKRICEFLGLDFSKSMLKPSFLGSEWLGNSFETDNIQKVSSQNAGRWVQRIEKNEAQVLEFHFSEMMEIFGYKRHYSDDDCVQSIRQHYSWFNYAQSYSLKIK